jgi:hypothetical protein
MVRWLLLLRRWLLLHGTGVAACGARHTSTARHGGAHGGAAALEDGAHSTARCGLFGCKQGTALHGTAALVRRLWAEGLWLHAGAPSAEFEPTASTAWLLHGTGVAAVGGRRPVVARSAEAEPRATAPLPKRTQPPPPGNFASTTKAPN